MFDLFDIFINWLYFSGSLSIKTSFKYCLLVFNFFFFSPILSNLDLICCIEVNSLYIVLDIVEIKSSILLPKKKIDNEDDYEEDPKENLINRLIEYEKYKEISEVLKKYEQDRKELYTKKPTDLEIYNTVTNEISEDFDLNDLMSALNKMLDRKKLDKPLNTKITNREYSITERSNQIKNILKNKKQVEFTDLFDIYSKDYIVITFLSILTMARHQELSITQDRNFGKIMIERVD